VYRERIIEDTDLTRFQEATLHMTDRELPSWAVRLRQERVRRLWSQKITAVHLRDAADEQTRAALPPLDSIQRYVRAYEAGQHAPGDLYAELYCRAFGLTRSALFDAAADPLHSGSDDRSSLVADDARSLTAWLTATNVSDDAVDDLSRAVSALAEAHSGRPPERLLTEVFAVHQRVQALLRSGKQRLYQTRELYRLDADLLAHASLLMGDLHRNAAAAANGATAQLCAREADSTQAIALSVRAKTARWRMQYAASAELARQGYECSPATPIRILLASQEANAAALLGDERRARQALIVAEAATEVTSPGSGVSAWSCSRPRQSLFAMSVVIRFHNSDAALGAAQLADTAWASGVPRVTGTWAQIRLGAGIARIIADDLHGALAEIAPVMNLAPEYRMATITAYTTQIEKRLQRRRFLRDSTAVAIRSRVHEFNAKALTRSGRGSA
jgi:hypothetical protein